MAIFQRSSQALVPRLSQIMFSSSSANLYSSNDEISPIFTNRNPRNLERLRIAYKPDGYYVDKPGKCYWHKLQLKRTTRHITAAVVHFENGEILTASTKEWAIKKQLFKCVDVSAHINLARILGQRCIESGITEMSCFIEPPNEDGRVASFLKTLKDVGITLTELPQYKTVLPWHRERPEKPWEIFE